MKKIIIYFFSSIIGFILFLPCILYFSGLSLVEGKPKPPESFVSLKEQEEIWRHIEKTENTPGISKINPYSFTINTLRYKKSKGIVSASLIARDYINTKNNNKKMSYWHLASAAMTIWVTRNWSEKEILSKLYKLYSNELPYNQSFQPTANAAG